MQQKPARPSFWRLTLYFMLSWIITAICAVSVTVVATYFFDLESMNESSVLWIRAVLAVLADGAGACLLGTLIRRRVPSWIAASIYVLPVLLTQVLALAQHSKYFEWTELIGAIVNLPICFFCIQWGGGNLFSRRNAMLDIPWKHWIWLLPSSAFQLTGVPLFLLISLWKIDLHTEAVEPSIFSLPSMIPRMVVCGILLGVCAAITRAHAALSEGGSSVTKRVLIVTGTWILLTAMQVLIIFACLGKYPTKFHPHNTLYRPYIMGISEADDALLPKRGALDGDWSGGQDLPVSIHVDPQKENDHIDGSITLLTNGKREKHGFSGNLIAKDYFCTFEPGENAFILKYDDKDHLSFGPHAEHAETVHLFTLLKE